MNKEQAKQEAEKIMREYGLKADEIERDARKNGTWRNGLDSNNGLFKDIAKEAKDKLKLLATMIDKE